jgi:uncharacterized protein involved in response to NO
MSHAVFRQPYRLFFLGAGFHAVLSMLAWALHLVFGQSFVPNISYLWHGYEMLFGYAVAVITGFILTAAENWTGRRTVNTAVLVGLFLFWMLARFSTMLGGPGWLTLLGDGMVLLGLTVALSRVLWLTGNRRNLRFVPICALLMLAALVYHASALGILPEWRLSILHLATDLVLILMVVMGGRVIPFFTQRRLPNLSVEDPDWLGFYTGFLVVLSVLLSWLIPGSLAAMASWFAGCFLMARLFYWSPLGTWREPMLWILHLGYFWLGIALFLRGGAMAWNWMPLGDTLHAVTIGGMGCLTLGMMARVSMGHGGHEIRAPWWLVPAFALVAVAAIPRLLAAWPALLSPTITHGFSASLWILSFLVFALGFLPILLKDRN